MPTYPPATSSTGGPAKHASSSSSASGQAASISTPATTMAPSKARQYAHLHAQLAQLNSHLADTEKLMRLTAAQAGDMRFLGGYVGGLFMGSAKVLGEEGVRAGTAAEESSGGDERKAG